MIVKRSVTVYLTDTEAKELREQIHKVFEDVERAFQEAEEVMKTGGGRRVWKFGIGMYPAINELLDLIDEALEL